MTRDVPKAADMTKLIEDWRRRPRAIAPMPLRPLEAEHWIATLVDWDGDRGLAPEALTAFGEYVAAACIPDPPGDEQLPPAVLHLRRTVAALARRALGRALS